MNADLDSLNRELESADVSVRAAAARQLASLGEDAAAAAVALVRCSGDENEELREWAVAALEDCGPPNAGDADALANLLTGRSADVAYWAATMLGRLQDGAGSCVGRLLAAFDQYTEPATRQRIVRALGEIGPPASDAAPLLESIAAASDDPRLQRLAERALSRIRDEG
jgi:HEAT repeat protein